MTLVSEYDYKTNIVTKKGDEFSVETKTKHMKFVTETNLPKLLVMMVGWGGNNGTTATAGAIANKYDICWETKEGIKKPNYFGSLILSSTVCLGVDENKNQTYTPMKKLVPFVEPHDMIYDGWDINSADLYTAMNRAQVLPIELQRKLKDYMINIKPRPGIYYPDFIAANQGDRADNVINSDDKNKYDDLEKIRQDIRNAKFLHNADKVIVMWTANTERFCEIRSGLNMTAEELMESIKNSDSEVSPSTIYAVASILEGCSFINGSPQNTLVPGVVELAKKHGVFLGGDDFKSGQTKMKSILVDAFVGAGLKVSSIVSYNHLGNNDGKNLSAPQQFRSKEISKSSVIDDMVDSNDILYPDKNSKPDHCVVIKYVPFVGDSKRALDEYTSEIFMGGLNTISMHNTCEDSLLATPIIYDLIMMTELCERVKIYILTDDEYVEVKQHPMLTLLSFFLKAPCVPENTPVINAFNAQREKIVNFLKALRGIAPNNNMNLEFTMDI